MEEERAVERKIAEDVDEADFSMRFQRRLSKLMNVLREKVYA